MQTHTPQRLTLYVAGASPRSSDAIRAVAMLLRDPDLRYELHVVDVHRSPGAAYDDGVLTVPAVVIDGGTSKSIVSGKIDEPRIRAGLQAER